MNFNEAEIAAFKLEEVGATGLAQFLKVLRKAEFLRRAEVIERIERDSGDLGRSGGSGVPVSSLREIYQIRLTIAEKANRQTRFAHESLSELREFVANLEESQEDTVRSWLVRVDDASDFHLFEAQRQRRVLGCFFGVDKRMVSAERWVELWGPDDQRTTPSAEAADTPPS